MSFKGLFKYFLIWQVMIIAVVTLASGILPLRESDTYLGASISGYLKNPVLNFRSNFDGVHYVLIAAQGYNYGQQAFFPLYPKLIHFFHRYYPNPIIIGVVINSISFFMALFFLNKLIQLDYSSPVSKWTILCLLIFPTSFFYSAVYTEGLFFLLVILSFYLVRTRHLWLGCIFAALAGYTRLVGIFLFPALLIEILSLYHLSPLKEQCKKLIPLAIVPLGLLIYMYYLHETTGDPLNFYHMQSAFQQQRSTHIILPYQVIWRYIKMIFMVNPLDFSYLTIWLEFLTGITFITLSIISILKQRLSYAIFNLFALMLPTLTGIFTSLPRYVLICFPVFILAGQAMTANKYLRVFILVTSGLLWIVYLSLFSRGYWVA